MKLYLSVSPTPDSDRREALLRAVEAAVPDSTAQFADGGATLWVEAPEHADRFTVLDAVSFRLGSFGYTVKEQCTRGQFVPPITNVPHFGGEKQPKKVRLSVFVASLVAVALIFSILAFSLGSSLTMLGLFGDGATLGVDGTESYSEKIGLIDTIFSQYALYDTNGDLLLDSMLKAYVAATGDQYAAYYTAEEFAELMAQSSGALVGIGVTVIDQVSSGRLTNIYCPLYLICND